MIVKFSIQVLKYMLVIQTLMKHLNPSIKDYDKNEKLCLDRLDFLNVIIYTVLRFLSVSISRINSRKRWR